MKHQQASSSPIRWKIELLLSTRSIPWVLLVLILTMIAAVLAWNAQHRYKDFTDYQQRLIESSVNGTAAQLEVLLTELKRSAHLFADTNQDRFRKLASEPDNEMLIEQLNTDTRKLFPESFAFTIADKHGIPLLTDFDGLTGDVCQRDMQTFATNREHSKVYIHPHPTNYHFDIMVDREHTSSTTGIFFVSFKTELLSRLLYNGQLPGHKLLLLKQDIPGLIELTADGPRVELHREFRLNDEEMNRIGYSVQVKGTLWNLVDLPDINLYKNIKNEIWRETTVIILIFAIVTTLMLVLYQRSQIKRREIEHAYNHDPVTGLPNRHYLMETLESMVEKVRSPKPFTLLIVDLGRMQRRKGTFFEHRPDDKLIKEISMRIKNALDGAIMVARIGDHDYAAIISGQDIQLIEKYSHNLLAALQEPFGEQKDLTLTNPCSGYARFPGDGEDIYELTRQVGMQIYAARQTST